MKTSWRALCYLWYNYQSKFYDCDKYDFKLSVDQMKKQFCTVYNVKTIYEISKEQVDKFFDERRHMGGKYIYFNPDYLEKIWGKP